MEQMHPLEPRPEQTSDDESNAEDEEKPVHCHSCRSDQFVQGSGAAHDDVFTKDNVLKWAHQFTLNAHTGTDSEAFRHARLPFVQELATPRVRAFYHLAAIQEFPKLLVTESSPISRMKGITLNPRAKGSRVRHGWAIGLDPLPIFHGARHPYALVEMVRVQSPQVNAKSRASRQCTIKKLDGKVTAYAAIGEIDTCGFPTAENPLQAKGQAKGTPKVQARRNHGQIDHARCAVRRSIPKLPLDAKWSSPELTEG